MKIISIVNQKGGVAKTTSTQHIGIALGRLGKRVLLIDFDPQGNLTSGLGINKSELKHTVYDLLKQEMEGTELHIDDVIVKKFDVDILPANIVMSKAEKELGIYPGKENFLKDIIQHLDYDYILIDCPPSLNILTDNALVASTDVHIPVAAEFYALEGINFLIDEIEVIRRRLNPNLKMSGVFITKVDTRSNLEKDTRELLGKYFQKELYGTSVRYYVDVIKASSEGIPIFDYNSKNNAGKDYIELAKEMIEREDK